MQTQETLSPENTITKQPATSGVRVDMAIPAVLLAILLMFVAYNALFVPSYFEDDRYNLGVARRSALPEAQYLLETSLTHFYFQASPIPRPEDWHRGISILLLAGWARLAGSSEVLMRVPHALWLMAWFYLAVRLLRLLNAATVRENAPSWVVSAVLVVGALVLNPWSPPVLQCAFLDDVPAAVFVLLALLILAQRGVSLLTSGIIGALCGLSFFAKDFYGLWALIGGLLVVGLTWLEEKPVPFAKLAAHGIVFGAAFALMLLPRFAWSLVESGRVLPIQRGYSNLAIYFHTWPKDHHYPWFLDDDTGYLNPVAMTGGVPALLDQWWHGPLPDVLAMLQVLGFAWLWLALILIGQRLHVGWANAHRRLTAALALAVIFYALLNVVGISHGSQTRYWVVPVTLAVVLGLNQSLALFHKLNETTPGRWRALSAAALVFAAVFAYLRPGEWLTALLPEPPTNMPELLEAIAQHLEPDQAVMMDVKSAMYYFSLYPQDHVVGFSRLQVLEFESEEKARRFFDTYNVRFALYIHAPTIERLKQLGFREVARVGSQIVLERPQ